MRGLTIHQPWASLIALGEKQVETRSWRTPYTGPLAIHAGKSLDVIAREFYEYSEELHDVLEARDLEPADLPYGAVIATATLDRCAPITDAGAEKLEAEKPLEFAFGNYSTDEEQRYAFVMTDVIALPEPVPCDGHQQLWRVDLPTRQAIAVQAARQAQGKA